ncbi:glycine/D-amino acid oxidase-like deaminating enzyme [Brevibacterium sanguinis]|uniref:Glycine/D-amino acid oxidase-like deaminating enzyme n=2 Tax=Brevibacterium TaxID=1696 RepID=A0A366IHL4_9MICO|nr:MULTISPECIES: FAD-dependent oxidoreductase [Brevibacterium]RBP63681.1 glycine/D-amino acid oxidase-like deaminating enzyme [Brevibacterium sanguinis]RBP70340.1 glycine/D-amino acid oxidase-like deaminating enzyme [Brevibacterium celere]
MSAPVWSEGTGPRPETAARLPVGDHVDVVVVGAGLTGLFTARTLAEAGRTVVVVEARSVGSCASGASTGKASLLQAARHSLIADSLSLGVAREHLRAHAHGLEEILSLSASRRFGLERASAFTVAGTSAGVEQVRREHEVCRELGLPVTLHESLDAPYPVHAALELPDQVQLDPLALLGELVAAVAEAGGRIVEGCRVTGLDDDGDLVSVETSMGDLSADHVVLATASPILDHVPTTTTLVPHRSYLCAFDVPDQPLTGMHISVDSPSRSLRTAVVDGRRRLLVGGSGHRTGEARSTRRLVDDLEAWTTEHFPGARLTHAWSAQDHHPVGLVPLVTTFGGESGRVHFAGGYSKWGVTGAPAAARHLTDRLLGRPETVSFGTPSTWGRAKNALRSQAKAPAMMAGSLVRDGLTGEARVDGEDVRVSLVCPHAGGICTWNDAESTWDCPLHGSRFGPAGTILEGPATTDLDRLR